MEITTISAATTGTERKQSAVPKKADLKSITNISYAYKKTI